MKRGVTWVTCTLFLCQWTNLYSQCLFPPECVTGNAVLMVCPQKWKTRCTQLYCLWHQYDITLFLQFQISEYYMVFCLSISYFHHSISLKCQMTVLLISWHGAELSAALSPCVFLTLHLWLIQYSHVISEESHKRALHCRPHTKLRLMHCKGKQRLCNNSWCKIFLRKLRCKWKICIVCYLKIKWGSVAIVWVCF